MTYLLNGIGLTMPRKPQARTLSDLPIIFRMIVLAPLFGLLVIFYWIFKSQNPDNIRKAEIAYVIPAMQKECAKSCGSHGLSWTDLQGPDFDSYSRFAKDTGQYTYSWHTAHNTESVVKLRHSWNAEGSSNAFIWQNQTSAS